MKLWRNVLVHVDDNLGTPDGLENSRLLAEAFGGRVFESPGEEGTPGRALLRCAARSGSDLIVKATSAADVRQMTVSGAAALHLLRTSPVPVLLHAPPARRSGRIIAAVNLSGTTPESKKLDEQVVLAAAQLSRLESAELHVVCVADRARDRLYESILHPAQYRRYLAEDRDDLRRSLAALTARLGPRSVPHLVEGNAVDALGTIAIELEADAVTLGRADADAGVGGYFAERLFCRIDRSVLLVTSKHAETPSNDTGTWKARLRTFGAEPAQP
ncbi:MAG TPA: hypothetical protein VGK73_20590 [Polyangiaceae bacterium]